MGAEWRPCAFGSKPYATMTRRIRLLHWDYTRGERERRRCKWRGEVCERDCATCPVPAVVEAGNELDNVLGVYRALETDPGSCAVVDAARRKWAALKPRQCGEDCVPGDDCGQIYKRCEAEGRKEPNR